jgi:hypothetical protein
LWGRPPACGGLSARLLQLTAILLALAIALRLSIPAALIAYVVAISSELVLAYISRPFDLPITRHLNAGIALAASIVGITAAFLAGWTTAIAILAGTVFILRLVRQAAYHRPGAVTPVWLALAGLLVEAFTISYIWIGQ